MVFCPSKLPVAILLALSLCAAASATDTNPALAQGRLANGGLITTLLAAPVEGQPYSAEQVHSTKRTLPDGSTVSHRGHHIVARDADGRVHVEMRLANGRDGNPDEVMVFVKDPVAHTITTWLSGGPDSARTASQFKLPVEQTSVTPAPRTPAPETGRPQPIISTEDLGTRTIDGLEASGKKTTTIVPIGRSGNSAPITKTYEEWTSPELQLVVKQEWTDPRSGERTVELLHLSRANPDPSLFRVPHGYEVKDAVQSLKALVDKLAAAQE